ncbi:transcriptional regulator [Parasphingorhabdus sp.]|uniref:transcriptional regulator n=1 Tax=Parasphingorhabdus sp. TaxID=2709688 RepID=UPI003592F427
MKNLSPIDALKMAIEKAGSQAKLAKICGVSSTSVWKWVNYTGEMPPTFVLKAEAATGVSRHELRPDIYPAEDIIEDKGFALPDIETMRADRAERERRAIEDIARELGEKTVECADDPASVVRRDAEFIRRHRATLRSVDRFRHQTARSQSHQQRSANTPRPRATSSSADECRSMGQPHDRKLTGAIGHHIAFDMPPLSTEDAALEHPEIQPVKRTVREREKSPAAQAEFHIFGPNRGPHPPKGQRNCVGVPPCLRVQAFLEAAANGLQPDPHNRLFAPCYLRLSTRSRFFICEDIEACIAAHRINERGR